MLAKMSEHFLSRRAVDREVNRNGMMNEKQRTFARKTADLFLLNHYIGAHCLDARLFINGSAASAFARR